MCKIRHIFACDHRIGHHNIHIFILCIILIIFKIHRVCQICFDIVLQYVVLIVIIISIIIITVTVIIIAVTIVIITIVIIVVVIKVIVKIIISVVIIRIHLIFFSALFSVFLPVVVKLMLFITVAVRSGSLFRKQGNSFISQRKNSDQE